MPDSKAAVSALGYTILYVRDVEASLDFYERAFGLKRRFFTDEGGQAYGELETGAARIGFTGLPFATELLGQEPTISDPAKPPIGFEIALLTDNVPGVYERALAVGATSLKAPEAKPWGQTVAYVRDNCGFVVEICTPLP